MMENEWPMGPMCIKIGIWDGVGKKTLDFRMGCWMSYIFFELLAILLSIGRMDILRLYGVRMGSGLNRQDDLGPSHE
jgi:hypothetical protein